MKAFSLAAKPTNEADSLFEQVKSRIISIDDLREQASSGNPHAKYTIARCHLRGIIRPQNFEEMHSLITELTTQPAPYADAFSLLGACFLEGSAVDKDQVRAAQLFQQGADLGSAISKNNLGQLYLGGLEISGKTIIPKNEEKADILFRESAALGNPAAMCNIGLMYFRKGTENLAFSWFEQGAALGDYHSMILLSHFYRNGIVVKKDAEKAEECSQKAIATCTRDADLGDINSLVQLAKTYINGQFVPQDKEFAISLLQRAVNTENPNANDLSFLANQYLENDINRFFVYKAKAAKCSYSEKDAAKHMEPILRNDVIGFPFKINKKGSALSLEDIQTIMLAPGIEERVYKEKDFVKNMLATNKELDLNSLEVLQIIADSQIMASRAKHPEPSAANAGAKQVIKKEKECIIC